MGGWVAPVDMQRRNEVNTSVSLGLGIASHFDLSLNCLCFAGLVFSHFFECHSLPINQTICHFVL